MFALEVFVRAIDRLNEGVGRVVSWLTLGTVLVCFTVVLLRYVFEVGRVWLQELYVWQHAVAFMLGAGYTLLHNGHVRVDLLYGRMSPRRQSLVNLIGTLVFLLPWMAVVLWTSVGYLRTSWLAVEPSPNVGGLPGFFLMKSVVWVFCLLVGLQGLALAGRSILHLSGREQYAPRFETP